MILNKAKLPVALLSGVIIGAVTFTAIGVNAHRGADLTEDERLERIESRLERKTEKLQDKVDEGVITAEQQAQIEAWMDERAQEKIDSIGDQLTKEEWQALSDEERETLKEEKRAERELRKAEAEEFFESIGIDKEDLFDGKRDGFGKKGHHKWHHDEDSDKDESSTEAVIEPAVIQVQ